jgi:AGZA family xanthine/uracil permease-like MFS transporter
MTKLFQLAEHKTNVRTEIIAGVTTFMTMAYIVFVQAQVLGAAGMDPGSVMVATCLAAAAGSILMGMLANYPIGLAPGMGENFFFTYTIVIGMGVAWEKALGIVFIAGTLFAILSIVKVREMVINAVPDSLKYAIAVGIGLFIAFIGLNDAGIVIQNPSSLVKLGNLAEPAVWLAMIGVVIIAVLYARGIKGSILIGMLIVAAAGIVFRIVPFLGIVSLPPSVAPTFLKMDIWGVLRWEYAVPILIFLYMDMFDTVGTLLGVSSQAGFIKKGKLPRASQALFSDAAGTMVGAAFGTSTVTAYIESIAGVKVGGRTGLTAVVVGIMFVLAIFFYPLVQTISGGVALSSGTITHPITAPALIIVGSLMMKGVLLINWDDISDALPAFVTMVGIPFTYSIADGIALGFMSYPLIKLIAGKGREVSWLVYTLAIIFILRYALLN